MREEAALVVSGNTASTHSYHADSSVSRRSRLLTRAVTVARLEKILDYCVLRRCRWPLSLLSAAVAMMRAEKCPASSAFLYLRISHFCAASQLVLTAVEDLAVSSNSKYFYFSRFSHAGSNFCATPISWRFWLIHPVASRLAFSPHRKRPTGPYRRYTNGRSATLGSASVRTACCSPVERHPTLNTAGLSGALTVFYSVDLRRSSAYYNDRRLNVVEFNPRGTITHNNTKTFF